MKRLITPECDSESKKHVPTPVKAKIQEAVEFCDKMRISYFKKNVFRVYSTIEVENQSFDVCLREYQKLVSHRITVVKLGQLLKITYLALLIFQRMTQKGLILVVCMNIFQENSSIPALKKVMKSPAK
jgi:hypothetical protein